MQSLRELWAFRATILAFAERDVRVKYKQAVLGIGWAVIQPLAFMTIFTLTIGRLAPVSGGGAPYAAFALALAALNVYYRDFRYALPFALQLWLFASPVAYPLSVVPEQWRGLYVVVNPAAGFLDAFRQVLALGQLPQPGPLAASLAGTAIIVYFGYRIFKSLEPNFADVI